MRCHFDLSCFLQLMRNASSRPATAKRLHGNNVIATDRPDRWHLLLPSNAMAGQGQMSEGPHVVRETIKRWCHHQSKTVVHSTILVIRGGHNP